MTAVSPAERLLQSLGITEPDEIDLEAIAFHLNAHVRVRPLDGCEARIIGHADSAVITVNERSSYQRRRFSIAHELGHWCYHRGKTLICRVEEMRPRDQASPEKVADSYAADLLLPRYIFQPVSRSYAKLNTKTIKEIAGIFHTSWTATAIRLVERGHTPAILVCHGVTGRKWFTRGPDVPSRWFPKDSLDAESFAFNVLHGAGSEDAMPRKIGADAWFDRWEAEKFDMHEQSFRTGGNEILTILLISDDRMLSM